MMNVSNGRGECKGCPGPTNLIALKSHELPRDMLSSKQLGPSPGMRKQRRYGKVRKMSAIRG